MLGATLVAGFFVAPVTHSTIQANAPVAHAATENVVEASQAVPIREQLQAVHGSDVLVADIFENAFNKSFEFFVNVLSGALGAVTDVLTTVLNKASTLLQQDVAKRLWGVVRNYVNYFLILILIVSSVMTILRVDTKNYSLGRILPGVVWAALLTNFSYLIVTALVGVADIFTHIFLGQIDKVDPETRMKPFQGIAHFLTDSSNVSFGSAGGAALDSLGSLVGFVIALIITILVFAAVALLWLARSAVLYVLLITSPIIFALNIVPFTRQYVSRWWDAFRTWALFGPMSAFLIFLAYTSLYGAVISAVGNGGDGTNVSMLIFLGLFSFILFLSAYIPLTQAGPIGKAAANAFQKYAKEYTTTGGKAAANLFFKPWGGAAAAVSRGYGEFVGTSGGAREKIKALVGGAKEGFVEGFVGTRPVQTIEARIESEKSKIARMKKEEELEIKRRRLIAIGEEPTNPTQKRERAKLINELARDRSEEVVQYSDLKILEEEIENPRDKLQKEIAEKALESKSSMPGAENIINKLIVRPRYEELRARKDFEELSKKLESVEADATRSGEIEEELEFLLSQTPNASVPLSKEEEGEMNSFRFRTLAKAEAKVVATEEDILKLAQGAIKPDPVKEENESEASFKARLRKTRIDRSIKVEAMKMLSTEGKGAFGDEKRRGAPSMKRAVALVGKILEAGRSDQGGGVTQQLQSLVNTIARFNEGEDRNKVERLSAISALHLLSEESIPENIRKEAKEILERLREREFVDHDSMILNKKAYDATKSWRVAGAKPEDFKPKQHLYDKEFAMAQMIFEPGSVKFTEKQKQAMNREFGNLSINDLARGKSNAVMVDFEKLGVEELRKPGQNWNEVLGKNITDPTLLKKVRAGLKRQINTERTELENKQARGVALTSPESRRFEMLTKAGQQLDRIDSGEVPDKGMQLINSGSVPVAMTVSAAKHALVHERVHSENPEWGEEAVRANTQERLEARNYSFSKENGKEVESEIQQIKEGARPNETASHLAGRNIEVPAPDGKTEMVASSEIGAQVFAGVNTVEDTSVPAPPKVTTQTTESPAPSVPQEQPFVTPSAPILEAEQSTPAAPATPTEPTPRVERPAEPQAPQVSPQSPPPLTQEPTIPRPEIRPTPQPEQSTPVAPAESSQPPRVEKPAESQKPQRSPRPEANRTAQSEQPTPATPTEPTPRVEGPAEPQTRPEPEIPRTEEGSSEQSPIESEEGLDNNEENNR